MVGLYIFRYYLHSVTHCIHSISLSTLMTVFTGA